LQLCGYALLEKCRNDKGRVTEWVWKISDSPMFSPDSGFRDLAKRDLENRYITKIDHTENEVTKMTKETQALPATSASKSKEEQLRSVKAPKNVPSEIQFHQTLLDEGLEAVLDRRPDLYHTLCFARWHQWKGSRWVRINDWVKYVRALAEKIEEAMETTNERT
ncbi:MAG: hypothetical protein ACRDEA_12840, partial [Microcystaceae cyanobacterium]